MSFISLLESINVSCVFTLQRKVNKFIRSRLPCRDVFIMFLSEYGNECIVQVVSDTVLEKEIRFSIQDIFDLRSPQVIEKRGEAIDSWLKEKFKSELYPYLENLLKVPIRHPEKESSIFMFVYLVDPAYTFENDEHNFSTTVTRCLNTCSGLILNAFRAKEEKHIKSLYEKLLVIARKCLLHAGDYNEILSEIMFAARLLTNAERCSLFLLSKDKKVAKIYDGERSTKTKVPEIAIEHGIISYVAGYGETVVVQEAHTHPLFPRNNEILPGLETRNVLCFPVRNTSNLVGVAALINKGDEADFTHADEEVAKAIGIFLGIALVNGILHRKIQIHKAQDLISDELLAHHLTRTSRDFDHALHCRDKHKYDEMHNFRWIPRNVSYSDTICYIVRMFDNLGLVRLWKIQKKTLIAFSLAVRRGYRDLPYHNWAHGFSVAQFAYFLIHDLKLMQNMLITGLETIAFLVSALCHDLDHRGTTNGFQILSESSLSKLYGSEGSVLERHHFSHTLTLLNTEHCNIFENLTVSQYSRVLGLIRDMIVATDLAASLKILPDQRNMSIEGYNPEKRSHRNLLLSLMITCCDLNDQLKGWIHCRNIAELIYSEFFLQGDKEKELGNVPLPSMDREKAFIPELQIEFLTSVCIPCYSVLSNIFPRLTPCVEVIEDTRKRWQGVIDWLKTNNIPQHLFLKYISDPSLEAFVLKM